MNKYLVIQFDRYDTEESTHDDIEAESPLDALLEVVGEDEDEDERAYYKKNLIKVSKDFSCVPGEESDLLIYTL